MNVEALTYKNEYKDGVLVQLESLDTVLLRAELRGIDNMPQVKKLVDWILEEWEK